MPELNGTATVGGNCDRREQECVGPPTRFQRVMPWAQAGTFPEPQHRRTPGEQPAEPDQDDVQCHPARMQDDSGAWAERSTIPVIG